jgi:hypothetical protein
LIYAETMCNKALPKAHSAPAVEARRLMRCAAFNKRSSKTLTKEFSLDELSCKFNSKMPSIF